LIAWEGVQFIFHLITIAVGEWSMARLSRVAVFHQANRTISPER
jgi:hypothetical protein